MTKVLRRGSFGWAPSPLWRTLASKAEQPIRTFSFKMLCTMRGMTLATELVVPNVAGRVTTLGTDLSSATGPWRRRRGTGKSREIAEARLAGTVWARSEVAVGVYRGALGLGRGLARVGVSANAVTYLSLGFALASCIAAALGAFAIAALFTIVSGLCDALDGVIARSTGTVSPYGALLDSTVDRVTDALPLIGVMLFFGDHPLLALIPGLAMLGTFVIPYARARAEALGIVLPGLFMRRPERVVMLVLFLLLGELSLEVVTIAAPLLLGGLLLLSVLNFFGAVAVLRTARLALAELEESKRAAGSNPTATGRA